MSSIASSNVQETAELAVASQPVSSIKQHCFSAQLLDTKVYFQVLDLGRQLFVWVGLAPAALGSLTLACLPPTAAPAGGVMNGSAAVVPQEPLPVTTLLGSREGGLAATSLVRRLALRVGRGPVALACDLPEDQPQLVALAEQHLLRELQALDLA